MTNAIEWCDETANPFTGCTYGCSYCYARRFSLRLAGKAGTVYHRLAQLGHDPFVPAIHMDKITDMAVKLKRTRKPKRIFLGSMSDIAHPGHWVKTSVAGYRAHLQTAGAQGEDGPPSPWAPRTVQLVILALTSGSPEHTFLMLTKRPHHLENTEWYDNVHMGVSVTSTKDAWRLVPELMRIQCGLRWASVEPLLDADFDPSALAGLGWIVVGAETGPGKPAPSPGHLAAAGRIVDWCKAQGIPCFVKSNMRGYEPYPTWPMEIPK